MSRLYFHSPSGDAKLHGSERAYLGGLCTDIALGVLAIGGSSRADRLADVLAAGVLPVPKGYDFQAWRRDIETRLVVGWRDPFEWRGEPIKSSTLILNTALVVGNDAVRLAARLQGQCEIHAWVDGPNRAWLADIMQGGLDRGVFRSGFWFDATPDGPRRWSDQGWEDVIALLRSRDDEPVVTSYSVCDSFPNRTAAGWEPVVDPSWRPVWADGDGANEWEAMAAADHAEYRREHATEQWDELPVDRQWELAMAGLRRSDWQLELRPEDWDTFVFGHELSVFDLFAHDRDARLDAALAEPSVVS